MQVDFKCGDVALYCIALHCSQANIVETFFIPFIENREDKGER